MGLFHSPNITMSALEICVDAGNTKSYSGSGATWTDIASRSPNNVTWAVTPTHANGVFTLNGTTHRATVSSTPLLDVLDTVHSFEFWCKPTTVDGNDRFFYCLSLSGANDYIAVYNSSNIRVYHDTTIYTITTSAFTQDVWHHVVLTFDYTATEWKLYIDNTLIDTITTTTTPSSTATVIDLFVDNDGGSYNQHFVGDMGMFRFYSKTLSAAEVNTNYLAHITRYR